MMNPVEQLREWLDELKAPQQDSAGNLTLGAKWWQQNVLEIFLRTASELLMSRFDKTKRQSIVHDWLDYLDTPVEGTWLTYLNWGMEEQAQWQYLWIRVILTATQLLLSQPELEIETLQELYVRECRRVGLKPLDCFSSAFWQDLVDQLRGGRNLVSRSMRDVYIPSTGSRPEDSDVFRFWSVTVASKGGTLFPDPAQVLLYPYDEAFATAYVKAAAAARTVLELRNINSLSSNLRVRIEQPISALEFPSLKSNSAEGGLFLLAISTWMGMRLRPHLFASFLVERDDISGVYRKLFTEPAGGMGAKATGIVRYMNEFRKRTSADEWSAAFMVAEGANVNNSLTRIVDSHKLDIVEVPSLYDAYKQAILPFYAGYKPEPIFQQSDSDLLVDLKHQREELIDALQHSDIQVVMIQGESLLVTRSLVAGAWKRIKDELLLSTSNRLKYPEMATYMVSSDLAPTMWENMMAKGLIDLLPKPIKENVRDRWNRRSLPLKEIVDELAEGPYLLWLNGIDTLIDEQAGEFKNTELNEFLTHCLLKNSRIRLLTTSKLRWNLSEQQIVIKRITLPNMSERPKNSGSRSIERIEWLLSYLTVLDGFIPKTDLTQAERQPIGIQGKFSASTLKDLIETKDVIQRTLRDQDTGIRYKGVRIDPDLQKDRKDKLIQAQLQELHTLAAQYYESRLYNEYSEKSTLSANYLRFHRFEKKRAQDEMVEWIKHASAAEPTERHVSLTLLLLEATWWWGEFIPYAFTTELLRNYPRVPTGEDADLLVLLQTFHDSYPRAFEFRHSRRQQEFKGAWEQVKSAIEGIQHILKCTQIPYDDESNLRLLRVFVLTANYLGEAKHHLGEVDVDTFYREVLSALEILRTHGFEEYDWITYWMLNKLGQVCMERGEYEQANQQTADFLISTSESRYDVPDWEISALQMQLVSEICVLRARDKKLQRLSDEDVRLVSAACRLQLGYALKFLIDPVLDEYTISFYQMIQENISEQLLRLYVHSPEQAVEIALDLHRFWSVRWTRPAHETPSPAQMMALLQIAWTPGQIILPVFPPDAPSLTGLKDPYYRDQVQPFLKGAAEEGALLFAEICEQITGSRLSLPTDARLDVQDD